MSQRVPLLPKGTTKTKTIISASPIRHEPRIMKSLVWDFLLEAGVGVGAGAESGDGSEIGMGVG